VTRLPVFEAGDQFSDKEKTGCQIDPFFNSGCFVTDADFSLWHISSSWSLDA
jgi:hypothetical protein